MHRLRSHHRPGGVTLLVQQHDRNLGQQEEGNDFDVYDGKQVQLLLMDHLTGSVLTLPCPTRHYDYMIPRKRFQSVQGLVCYHNTIWNLTTRNIIHLPPQQVNAIFTGTSVPYLNAPSFFLGFDAMTNQYKVLSICHIFQQKYFGTGSDGHDLGDRRRVIAQVTSLGTNLWREVDIPECVLQHLTSNYTQIERSCYIEDRIYVLSRYSAHLALLAFNVRDEKFQILHLSDGFDACRVYIIDVRGRAALIDNKCTAIWILEDFDNANWKKVKLTWPASWIVNPSPSQYSSSSSSSSPSLSLSLSPPTPDPMEITPICSMETGEILFESREMSRHSTKLSCFYYDIERASIRKGPRVRCKGEIEIVSKYVETLFSLP